MDTTLIIILLTVSLIILLFLTTMNCSRSILVWPTLKKKSQKRLKLVAGVILAVAAATTSPKNNSLATVATALIHLAPVPAISKTTQAFGKTFAKRKKERAKIINQQKKETKIDPPKSLGKKLKETTLETTLSITHKTP